MSTPTLSVADLAVAAALVVVNAALSLALDLRLARQLLVAGARVVVQLLLVGWLLRTVFAMQSAWSVAAVLSVMWASAACEISARQAQGHTGAWRLGIGAATKLMATSLVTALALGILRPQPWYSPQVTIPLAGIVLGSVMNSVSISLNAFSAGLVHERVAIESRLALGASRQEALKSVQRSAVRSGLIPIVNQMSAAGIITLPGMMTGQVLAGMAPLEAAKYQILILLLLAGGAGFGACGATAVAMWRTTDGRHRLRLDRLEDA